MRLSAETVRDMPPEERRKLLADISFPKITKPREQKLADLSDEQVTEALTLAVWLGLTGRS